MVVAEIGLQPGALAFLGLQVRVDDLCVDDDEMALLVIKGRELVAEMVLPQGEMILVDPGSRGPVVGLVADIVVAGREPGRVAQRIENLEKAPGRIGVEPRNRRNRMDDVADMDDKGKVARIEFPDDMAHAPVGKAP